MDSRHALRHGSPTLVLWAFRLCWTVVLAWAWHVVSSPNWYFMGLVLYVLLVLALSFVPHKAARLFVAASFALVPLYLLSFLMCLFQSHISLKDVLLLFGVVVVATGAALYFY